MNIRDIVIADFETQLETTEFGNEEKEDDSYQYMIEQLDLHYRKKEDLDNSLTIRDIVFIINTLDNLNLTLRQCYEEVLKILKINI